MPTSSQTRAGEQSDRNTLTLTVTDACAEVDWDTYVRRNPAATGYHLWGVRRIIEQAFGHECAYLAALHGDNVVGILPLVLFRSPLFGRFAVSLPFFNYGGVVADSEAAARALLERVTALARARGLSHVELRHEHVRFPELPAKRHKVGMRLALPASHDALWQGLDRKVRNLVRKAEKANLTVKLGGAELIPDFYRVFARNMRDLGTPVYTRRLFEAVLNEFSDSARVFAVFLGTEPVAASVTVQWRDSIEVPWASSLREQRALSPNMLLYWAMLKHAIDRGCQTFDFGRSTPNEGTFHFKQQWGAEPTPFAWEYKLLNGGVVPDQGPTNPKFRLAIEMWKRLPLPVTTMLGPYIVRSIP